MLCALGLGIYEQANAREPLSDLIVLSLSVATGDPYIVKPPSANGMKPVKVESVERLLLGIVQILKSADTKVRARAATVLANTTNSWPSMDPSRLSNRAYGTGLFAVDQVRHWLLHVLKESRTQSGEPTALAILSKLRTADYRDLHPAITEKFKSLSCSSMGARVSELFQAMGDFYPTARLPLNEQCELLVYELYADRQRGLGAIMERMYGPRLRYAPEMERMLKKGLYQTSYARFHDWYPDEDEPR